MGRLYWAIGSAVGLLATAASARAELWNPLMMVPHPNVIIAHDTSVTMGIDDNCNNCHIPGRDRLATSKLDIAATLPEFSNYFTYGSYRYSGCGSAKIEQPLIMPTPQSPAVSLAQVLGSIQGAQACGSSERQFPGGNTTTCATPGCNDFRIVQDLLFRQLPGFDPLGPFRHDSCAYRCNGSFYCQDQRSELGMDGTGLVCTSTDAAGVEANGCSPALCINGGCYHVWPYCTNPLGQRYDWTTILTRMSQIDWPRWEPTALTPQQVEQDLCSQIRPILRDAWAELQSCRPDRYYGYGTASLIDGNSWCDPNVLAQSACAPGSPLRGTCICNSENPACLSGGRRVSDCGVGFDWKARQQVAVCQAYDPAPGAFVDYFRSQPDNVVNANGCRENAVLFFTDGYMGDTRGVAIEADQAHRRGIYDSSGYQNMAVFRVANAFSGQADAMMRAMSANQVQNAYQATDRASMQEGFARLLNRTYRGVYTGSAPAQDSYGTRVAYHLFAVPGYDPNNPQGGFVDSYLGWPARIAVYPIDPRSGVISDVPVFETDWSDRVSRNPTCRSVIGDVATGDALGLNGQFRNGRPRRLNVASNSIDRDGDGVRDPHPALTLGGMYSTGASKVLVVDAPREAPPAGGEEGPFVAFQQSVRGRPRVYYTLGNGVLHGFHGGVPTQGGRVDRTNTVFNYNDADPQAGVEIVRYTPNWVRGGTPNNRYNFGMNDLVQQNLTSGQLTAREVLLRRGYRTVLVGAQGGGGSGYFSLDVTDPCQASVLAEWNLPAGDSATTDPTIYTFPSNTVPRARPAVVVTGGLGGSARLYAYDVENGQELARIALPGGGRDYPTAPVCLDLTGKGTITACYVVRSDGALIRARVDADRFSRVDDITPAGIVGGGRVFQTPPAVFFLSNGDAGIVYGSGDTQNLTTSGGQNFVYKVVDNDHRRAGGGGARTNNVCGGADPNGVFALAPGERVISPPVVRSGVVAWTAFLPDPNTPGCNPGRSSLYAMNFETCADSTNGNARVGPLPGPDGLPTSPEIHPTSGTVLVATAAGPTPSQTLVNDVRVRGNGTWAKRIYWRLQAANP
ncbi:MAG: hypothetical protein IPG45_15215 [Deltaproteobacteria bacterium]|jgi:hypothetical protein|nr:hypothetical protein [Deltaproteobacteria bacterium]